MVRVERLTVHERATVYAYAAMIVSWLFDFRAEGAGQGLAIQAFFILSYICSAVWFFSLTKFPKLQGSGSFLLISIIFLCVSVFSSVIDGQELYAIFRNAFTFLIFVTITYATALISYTLRWKSSVLRSVIAMLCFGYLLSTFLIVAMFQGGIDATSVRYSIIGTSIVAALSYGILALRVKLSRVEAAVAVLAVSIVLLSVTRTWLVVVLVQLIVMLIFSGFLTKRILIGGCASIAIVVLAVGSLMVLDVPVQERWMHRMSASERNQGIDPTFLTRQRQNTSMVEAILRKPLVGNGFSGQSSYWLEKSIGGSGAVTIARGVGHNQHLSIIFMGGILGGLPLLLLLFWHVIVAIGVIVNTRRKSIDLDLVHLGLLGSSIVIGTVVYGFLGGTFGSRGLTLWYGVGTGLLISVSSYLNTTKRLHHMPKKAAFERSNG